MFECFGNVNNVEVLNNNVEVLNSYVAVNEPDDLETNEVNFEELYMQFVRDTEEE